MKPTIAILGGGDSKEYDVSVRSTFQIMESMNKEKYNPFVVMVRENEWKVKTHDGTESWVDMNDFSFMDGKKKIRFDYAFIIIHGTPGENGLIQSYLEMQRIPYNTCRVLTSAITFNKHVCKILLKNYGILSAESVLIRKGGEYSINKIKDAVGLPCFVKPNNGGSSVGTSKVSKTEDLEPAIELAFREDAEVIIESFIKGTEISCGLLKTKAEEYIFPLTEIISENEFFDYEAKYTAGKAKEITPAKISEDVQKRCRQLSSDIYDYLSCRGIVRIDFILKGNQLYFLELNSVPGMSTESIVPQQIRAMGLKMEDILEKIIEDTI